MEIKKYKRENTKEKKTMKKRILGLILSLVLLSVSVPIAMFATAAESTEYPIYVGGIGMQKGDYLPVGATKTQSQIPQNSGYAYYNGLYLSLVDYAYEGDGYLIKETNGSQTFYACK